MSKAHWGRNAVIVEAMHALSRTLAPAYSANTRRTIASSTDSACRAGSRKCAFGNCGLSRFGLSLYSDASAGRLLV